MIKNSNFAAILLLLSVSFYRSNGQTLVQAPAQAKELQQLIAKKVINDTIRINAMNDLAEYYGRILGQFDSSLFWSQQAEELSMRVNYSHGLSIATSLSGSNYLFLGYASEAQKYFFRALKIAEETKDKKALASIQNFLGMLYLGQGKYKDAIECYRKSLHFAQEIDDKKFIFYSHTNIGETYLRQEQYKSSLESFFYALRLQDKFNDNVALANLYYLMGTVYSRLSQYTLAEKYCLRALELAEKAGAVREETGAFTTLSMIYAAQGKYSQAITTALRALALADSIKLGSGLVGEKGDALKTLVSVYDTLGNHQKAFAYYKQYIAIRDSLQNGDIILATNRLKEEYENEKKAKLLQAEQERAELLRAFFFVGFAMVVLVALVLGRLYQQKKKANDEILRQQRILEDQAYEIELANDALKQAHEQSESLLLNILPAPIAHRLKSGERAIADKFDSVTVLFADIVGFTKLSVSTSPEELVQGLNTIFGRFDELTIQYGLEKIKTIGDAYMIAGGLPERSQDHTERVARFALAMQHVMNSPAATSNLGGRVQVRIGIHTGEAVAGVIGTSKFAYDLWGDTVNTASRMESHGEPGKIHVSEEVYRALGGHSSLDAGHSSNDNANAPTTSGFLFEERGEMEIKGKGLMRTWFLTNETV
ncbi:MAG: adenylate/guanylate cyclase domain-containing protein [Candidatus Kapaibacteriota bacterium]